MWLSGWFNHWWHAKVWTPTAKKLFLRQDSHICLDIVTAGKQVIIRFRLRRLAPRDPLTHTSVQVSVLCWIFSPRVKVTSARSDSLSPRGWYSVSGKRRNISHPTSLDRLTNQSVVINELGFDTAASCKDFSLFVPPSFFPPKPLND